MTPKGPDAAHLPVTVQITSDAAQLAEVRVAVEAAARAAGFNEMTVSSIVLAIDEAICNVIKHGYQGRSGEPIEVLIETAHRQDRAGLQFVIRDRGQQVEPTSIVGRNLEEVRPGGLGTHIIRAVMDEVEYTSRRPQGMELRLVKLLNESVPAAPPDTGETR